MPEACEYYNETLLMVQKNALKLGKISLDLEMSRGSVEDNLKKLEKVNGEFQKWIDKSTTEYTRISEEYHVPSDF